MAVSRDPWLDNAKMGLILLVVLGHTWALLPMDGPAGQLYDFVYLWHMPAFVFLSGYLSRGFTYSPTRMWQLVTTLLVPYVLFEGALGWFRLHVGDDRLEDLWLDPHFPMWYLLALVAWRLVTPLLRPLPGAFLLAVVIGVGSGFLTGEWMELLDLPRILGFLPFFVLGLKTTPEALHRCRDRIPAGVGALVLGVIAVLALNLDSWASRGHLYQRPFDMMGESETSAVLTRLLVLAVGLAGTVAWLAVVPRAGGWFSRMGAATMTVYLFHGFAVKGVEYAGVPAGLESDPLLGVAVATAFGVVLTLALAAPPTQRLLCHVVDPFGTAERRVKEAVELAVVVREHEEAAEPVPAGR